MTTYNFIQKQSNGKHVCLYFGVRCMWMCGSFGEAVHVNSGVREGSPSRRSYERCATYRLSNKQNHLCNMAKVYGSSLFDMAVCTKSIRLL